MPDKARQNALRACVQFYFSMPPGATRCDRLIIASRRTGRGRARARFPGVQGVFLVGSGA